MIRTRRRPRGLRSLASLATAAAVLAVTGCSGGDADTTAGSTAGSTAATESPVEAAPPVDDDAAATPPAPADDRDGGKEKPSSPTPDAAPPSDAAPAPEPAPTSAAPAEPVVPDVLRFEATTVSGASFEGASVAGRPVVLWFWAPWCAVCRSQAPEVTDLAEEYGDEVAFVGVGSLDSGDAIESFAEDVAGPTHLSDPDGELYQRFGIAEQSSFVVLDADGDEVLRTGYADDDALAGTVADLAG